MKFLLAIFLGTWVSQLTVSARFFFITHQDRAGNLHWTNLLCTTTPVYEILRAESLTGSWTHVAYVTNQTQYTLSNTIPAGSTAFYKLAWTSDAPVAMDYFFDEGFGFPSIAGNLTLDFSSFSATWFFQDLGFYEGEHPLGPGFGPILVSNDLQFWFVFIDRTFDDRVYLSGVLGSSPTASGCEYTGYGGAVFHENFAGTEEQIGEFFALKPQ